MTPPRLTREEIALRLLESYIRAGKLIGPEEIKQAFSLAMSFEEHSDRVGGRPWRIAGSRKLGRDEDEP